MSLWGSVSRLAQDSWHGNSNSLGDAAGVMSDVASHVPILDFAAPDADEARGFVNQTVLGNPEHQHGQGNTGNHIGTVVGGIAGLNPLLGTVGVGVPAGMALGSQAGGWIEDHLF